MSKAAVFTEAGKPLEIHDYPLYAPAGPTARLRLAISGVCGTDIHIFEGRLGIPPPFIPGHEFVGHVEALGPDALTDGLGAPLREGDAAIACVAIPCGVCFNCMQGETASCLSFGVTYLKDPAIAPHLFGGFAEHLYSPAKNLVKIPEGLDLDAVAAFPCAGPTVIRAWDFAGGVKKDELVVVQGTGPVGLFTVAWAAAAGCHVIAIGSCGAPERLRLAYDLGAEEVLDYRLTSPEERLGLVKERVKALDRGDGADVVFEASGSPAAIPEGLELVRTLGRYIVPGQYSNSGTVAIAPHLITFKAIRIVGSGQYKLNDIAVYLDFLQKHPEIQKQFAACITHRYRVDQANEAWDNASKGCSIKAVFVG